MLDEIKLSFSELSDVCQQYCIVLCSVAKTADAEHFILHFSVGDCLLDAVFCLSI